MNYQKIYNDLIFKAKHRKNLTECFDFHHIVPRCLGGKDLKENLVKLTHREHFIAHFLLFKIAKTDQDKRKLGMAFNRMCDKKNRSKDYSIARKIFSKYHPCKDPNIKNKISTTLRHYHLNQGKHEILCNCGCGEILCISKNKNKMGYISGHRICKCGCGLPVSNSSKSGVIDSHKFIEKECACGCKNIKIVSYKRKNTKVYIHGHNKSNNEKISNSLKKTLSKLTPDELSQRILNSCGKCDNIKRGKNISKGKRSIILLETPKEKIKFFSNESKLITGFSWNYLWYKLRNKEGLLPNGNKVSYIFNYGNTCKKKSQ